MEVTAVEVGVTSGAGAVLVAVGAEVAEVEAGGAEDPELPSQAPRKKTAVTVTRAAARCRNMGTPGELAGARMPTSYRGSGIILRNRRRP
ncbi:hypothetical protein GCM10027595_16130 [Corynebacterium nasicanis]